jgi:hypothetical protein
MQWHATALRRVQRVRVVQRALRKPLAVERQTAIFAHHSVSGGVDLNVFVSGGLQTKQRSAQFAGARQRLSAAQRCGGVGQSGTVRRRQVSGEKAGPVAIHQIA